MKEHPLILAKRIKMQIEFAIEGRIIAQVRKTFLEKIGFDKIVKIGTEAYLVQLRDRIVKVRVSYSKDTKKRGPEFLTALEIHRELQEVLSEVPKIISYVTDGSWKFKFVEWVEGMPFRGGNKGNRFESLQFVPEGHFYKFGCFMFKLRKLGIYGNDGQPAHALYRPDMDKVIFCDLGTWALSRNKKTETRFLRRFLATSTPEQRRRFNDGFRNKK